MKKSNLLTFTLIAALGAGLAAPVMADTHWQKTHPRREQVNNRLENQNDRIQNKVKDGQMTKQQAHKLHREDKRIRNEERNMASHDNGHLTKQDQARINNQENRVSNQIKNQ